MDDNMKKELPQTINCYYSTMDNTTNIGTTLEYLDRRVPAHTIGSFNSFPFKTTNEILLEDKKPNLLKKRIKENMTNRRLVKVMIVDPDENVPVDKAVLVNEPEKITDFDDQELFFELDMKRLLEAHNTYRTSLINKKLSTGDKPVFLEPIRIKDLKMVVLNIADF